MAKSLSLVHGIRQQSISSIHMGHPLILLLNYFISTIFTFKFHSEKTLQFCKSFWRLHKRGNKICELKTVFLVLTSMPPYVKPSDGFRSFGCCTWSESLIWHKTLSLSSGLTLIDLHLSSIVHLFLQLLCICTPTGNVKFFKIWLTNAYPSFFSVNLTRRQLSINKTVVNHKCAKRLSKIRQYSRL